MAELPLVGSGAQAEDERVDALLKTRPILSSRLPWVARRPTSIDAGSALASARRFAHQLPEPAPRSPVSTLEARLVIAASVRGMLDEALARVMGRTTLGLADPAEVARHLGSTRRIVPPAVEAVLALLDLAEALELGDSSPPGIEEDALRVAERVAAYLTRRTAA
ncbi:MAG: hypothetical protein AVDCRST_MAG50-1881 [uncultured Acidimicrobiales bacterium]|uniref:DUF4129 domain-containing protein n=1 Tax=uncultured Acidimicrobiales bacterium TaxID=310071 RepID=A0A6J4I790_9ACTN|nr:MAG: hypothetical protein AVDCRST_MAG50-1881 [uncultured Acidimicrobiales bacterium]